MSTTIMPNAITTGVRRLQTLGAMWGLSGAPSDLGQQMITDGYDIATIVSLSNAGVTDAQLQNLYDNYGAGTPEFQVAANQLLTSLTGGPGGAASAPGYPQGAIPIVQTDLGVLDLSLRSTWDNLSLQFAQIGQQLNAIAAQNPNDPATIQMRSQYNSLAQQFSSAWSKVFGSSAGSVTTLGDWTDIAVGSGFVVIGGILIASGVGVPLVATIVLIASGLAVLTKWINSRNAQTAATQTVASAQGQTMASLNAALAAAQAKGDMATVNQILATMRSIGITPPGGTPPSQPTNWSAWLQQNMGLLVAGLAAIVVIPAALRRR
jgi:hypothetical protein